MASDAPGEVPVLYDINIDAWRAVTQRDVDQWQAFTAAHGRFLEAIKQARDTLREAVTNAHPVSKPPL